MRICLLTDDYEGSDSPIQAVDIPCDPRPWLPEEEWSVARLSKRTAVRRVLELAREGYDVFFNLCDGAWDEDRPGIEVVQALERLDQTFTGATSRFYEPSREAMKRVSRAWGIAAPRAVLARGAEDVERAADTLAFPLIVKHPSSYGSIGLTRESKVEEPAALARQAAKAMAAFGGALIEEFVEGREFSVLVAEDPADPWNPTTYAPVEFCFPEGETFKTFDLKWVDWRATRDVGVDDPDLETALRSAAANLFVGLDGAGYGRCDLRVDAEGRPWMLEINPNCGIFYPPASAGSADLCLLRDPAGHAGFIRQVLAAAFARRERRRTGWEVGTDADGGSGLYATRRFRAGDRILPFEERPHVLVTRSRVERQWDEPRLSWFRRYAWPLTEEVWVVWDDDPMEWKPIDHCCDPNAWLEGLDVVARRPIEPGEAITVDYATFTNEVMPEFECACGAPECRGTIRGTDHLEPFVARYGDHVSDYVRRKRESGGAAGRSPGRARPPARKAPRMR